MNIECECESTNWNSNLPVLCDLEARGRRARAAPAEGGHVVADCDREAAIVGPDQLDQLSRRALDGERLLLACVQCFLAARGRLAPRAQLGGIRRQARWIWSPDSRARFELIYMSGGGGGEVGY